MTTYVDCRQTWRCPYKAAKISKHVSQKTSSASLPHYGCPRTDMSRYNNGYITSLNCRIRSSENPYAFHEKSLHPQKISVRCTLSYICIVGTILFEVSADSEAYQHIITYFISMSEHNKLLASARQCHMSHFSWNNGFTKSQFDNHPISKSL